MINAHDLQNMVGPNIVIKSGGNTVKWQFADKNARKTYGTRTYTPVKGQSVSSVASEINSIASRM